MRCAFDRRTGGISDKCKATIKDALERIGIEQFNKIIEPLLTVDKAGGKMLVKALADLRQTSAGFGKFDFRRP